MHFTIHPEIFDRFPGLVIAMAIAEGIDNQSPNPVADAFWEAAWHDAHRIANEYESAQAHPRVAAWRSEFKAMGLAPRDFRSSIEALMRRARGGGEPFRISPVVDFYNAISLRHVIPAGGYDLDALGESVELRFTREGDVFQALGTEEAEPLPAGEVAYMAGNYALVRHFVWRQSHGARVVPETTRLFMVAEILGEVGHAAAVAMLDDMVRGFEEMFGVRTASFLLDASQPSIEVPPSVSTG